MAKQVTTGYTNAAGLGTAIFVQIRNPTDGSILVSRRHGGVREDVTGSGFYVWSGSVSPSLEAYESVWDHNGAEYGGEIVIPEPDVTVSGGGSGTAITTVLAATAPASINPLQFTMKRGDTDPSIIAQALYPDPANTAVLIPWPIPDGSTVKFTMRDSADFANRTRTAFTVTTPKVHADANIDDAANGIMSYGWVAADTNTDGLFRAEFEVTSGSEIRTFPVGTDDTRNWIAVTIVDDLDPGINP